MTLSRSQLERLFSGERLSTYIAYCDGNLGAAIELYRWNAEVTAAFWEPIGHLEVALRNTLSAQLAARHLRLGREATWLADPNRELSGRAQSDITAARARVRRKGKCASEGQTISELSFGFWRFLITKKLTGLWPDLASAFPHAPDRKRETIEKPIARLHDFRNRLAHHQRIWNRDPQERYRDLLAIAGYIDPGLPGWIGATSTVPHLLSRSKWRFEAPSPARPWSAAERTNAGQVLLATPPPPGDWPEPDWEDQKREMLDASMRKLEGA